MTKRESHQTMLLGLWQQAADNPIGIRVVSDDRKLLQQQLYRIRAELGKEEFARIVIITPEADGELLLVKRDADE